MVEHAAKVLVEAVKADLKPRDIVTKKAIENAIAVIMPPVDRPTPCCISWRLPMPAEVPWTIDDFERVRQRTPVLCDLKPSGQYLAIDLHHAGGIPQVMKVLLERRAAARRLHHDHRQDRRENLAEVPDARAPTRP